jgi:seryl-tRNA synthetase
VNDFTLQVQSKLQQFNAVTKELDGLNVYNQQMQSQLDNQVSELAQLAKSIEEVSIIERQISPLMARMISTLENFVKLDVPFLEEERNRRVNDLNEMMIRADISVSEKFRRVLEAYQVEVDYGRTIEAYSGLLTVEGQQMDVDFLRVGRVSFIYQTRDGSRLGQWEQTSGQWQTLSQDYRLGVNKALRIARKQLAPDLIMVPLTNTQAKL